MNWADQMWSAYMEGLAFELGIEEKGPLAEDVPCKDRPAHEGEEEKEKS